MKSVRSVETFELHGNHGIVSPYIRRGTLGKPVVGYHVPDAACTWVRALGKPNIRISSDCTKRTRKILLRTCLCAKNLRDCYHTVLTSRRFVARLENRLDCEQAIAELGWKVLEY